MYTRHASLKALSAIQHDFLDVGSSPNKLQPGGPGYELVYSCTQVLPYLRSLSPAGTLSASFDRIKAHELTLVKELIGYLESRYDRGVRLVGDGHTENRVPTISFVVVGQNPMRSRDVIEVFNRQGWVRLLLFHAPVVCL